MLYLVFVFGLIAGSFLNVVIYRLKSGDPIGFSRSFCPECKTQLKWNDLFPVLSFIFLRGRCRHCGKKISWQYPIVEILSGLVWIGVFYQNFNNNFSPFGGSPAGGQFPISNFQYLNIFYEILIFSALLVIAVYDFKWRIIPDKIVYPAITVALVYNIFNSLKFQNFEIFKYLNFEIFIYPLFTATIAFLFFFFIYYFSSGRAMGLGDAKLAILIGLFLEPVSALAAFMLAFIIGAVFGIILIGLGRIFPNYQKWGLKSQIAFGPFLTLGAFLVFFFSDFIINFFQP